MENIPKVAVPEAAPPVEVPMSQVDESRLSLDERFARFFAPPTKPVGVGFIAAYVSAQFFLFLTIVVDVLPDPEHSGKDLGVFNIANALPQSLAPFIAPVFLAMNLVIVAYPLQRWLVRVRVPRFLAAMVTVVARPAARAFHSASGVIR